MGRPIVSRRSFGIGIATVSALPLAGCMDGGDGDDGSDGDDGENNSDGDDGSNGDGGNESDFEYSDREEYTLTVTFENEDGDPVSHAIEGELAPVDFTAASFNFSAESVVEGMLEIVRQEGTWTLTVNSTEDEFETVEEEVTLESDTEITMTLEGALPDSERDTEDGDE